MLILSTILSSSSDFYLFNSQGKWHLCSALGDPPPRPAQRWKDLTNTDRRRVGGHTKNGSSISFVPSLPTKEPSSSESESDEDGEENSQEYAANYAIADDNGDEIRVLNAKIRNLMSHYRDLHHRYSMLIETYNKLNKRAAC